MQYDDVRQKYFTAISALEPDIFATLQKAFDLAEKEHQGQLRKQHKNRPEGEMDPYLIHPMRVSLILMNEVKLCDVTALTAAILHDVVEDGNSRPSVEDIKKDFGAGVAEAVRFLTKPEGENGPEALIPYHESFLTAPLVVRLVKLSDRLDNIRETLLIDRPKFQHRYLKETREIYLPIAKMTSLYFCAQYKLQCDSLEQLLNSPIAE